MGHQESGQVTVAGEEMGALLKNNVKEKTWNN